MERPRQILRFATFAVVANLTNFAVTLLLTQRAKEGVLGGALGVVLLIALVVWTVQGRSAIGRLVLTIWLAFGVGSSLAGFAYMLIARLAPVVSPAVQALTLIATAANIAALAFLWSPAASAWLAREKAGDG